MVCSGCRGLHLDGRDGLSILLPYVHGGYDACGEFALAQKRQPNCNSSRCYATANANFANLAID
jgi:hypothetical protein